MSGKGGGGGGTGASSYPTYLQSVHANILAGTDLSYTSPDSLVVSLVSIMNAAHTTSGNPFIDSNRATNAEGIDFNYAYAEIILYWSQLENLVRNTDPDNDIADMLSTLQTAWFTTNPIPAIDISADVATAVAGAIVQANAAVAASAIDSRVAAFKNSRQEEFQQGVSRFAAGFAEVNAVQISAFGVGLGLMENSFSIQLAEYRANLENEVWNKTFNGIVEGQIKSLLAKTGIQYEGILRLVDMAKQLFITKVDNTHKFVSLLTEVERIRYLAEFEENKMNIELNYREAVWDLEVFNYASGILAAVAGGVASTGQAPLTTGQSALGGALSGASMGASVAGPYGAAIGGVLGGLAGWLGG